VPRRRKYRVQWTQPAGQDLESIVEFIARDNIANALQVLRKIQGTAASLEKMPERGRIVPELAEVGLRLYHEILSPPWRIIYRIVGPTVFVMTVIDGRRNVEDILLERLTR
jgi:plasmid stabilization system protein ParE